MRIDSLDVVKGQTEKSAAHGSSSVDIYDSLEKHLKLDLVPDRNAVVANQRN